MTDLTARLDAILSELSAREDRWKMAWESGEMTHEEASSAALEDRWAYAQLADLLVLAREQQAAIDAVRDFIGWCDAAASREEEFYSKGKISAIVTAERLREALEAKP
jgi:hypothetical protein